MKINSEKEMLAFGEKFAKSLASQSGPIVIELIGDIGSGKTTFTRGLAKGLGIIDSITSPSFTISKTYPLKNRQLIHYDFYRLEDPGLLKEDLSENLNDKNNIIVIEWGQSIADLLPKNHIKINFSYDEESGRIVTI